MLDTLDTSSIALPTIVIAVVFIIYLTRQNSTHKNDIHYYQNQLEAEKSRRNVDLANEIKKREEITEKYSGIINIEKRIDVLTNESSNMYESLKSLRDSYKIKKDIFDKLKHDLGLIEDKLAFSEYGHYEPVFNLEDSEEYKEEIRQVRDEQKLMISNKIAAVCKTKWHVEGSYTKGQTMTNRGIRLTLRAFNNECNYEISKVKWNNVNAVIAKITKARDQIDKANASDQICITDNYLNLKIQELRLTHEYREKQKQEKDERSEMLRQEREEKKLLKDAENAQQEEDKYEALLEQARKEAGSNSEDGDFQRKIEELERELEIAHSKNVRAQAMAQMTKSGFVYIISNKGSFGENVIKIGMTRRLEPLDRVKELSDASVPFSFDVHAMIYSDDAPSLERALHSEFNTGRVNTQNSRKEFFYTTIDEIEMALKRLSPESVFHRDMEAQEYHESIARRSKKMTVAPEKDEFPADL